MEDHAMPTLPNRLPADRWTAEGARTPAGSNLRPRLIVVEDDGMVREVLAVNLRARGYDVRAFATGDEALEALAQGVAPEVLVVDFQLEGGTTGLDVMATLAAQCREPVRGLLITGALEPEPDSFEPGEAVTVLRRPFGLDRFFDTLQKVMES